MLIGMLIWGPRFPKGIFHIDYRVTKILWSWGGHSCIDILGSSGLQEEHLSLVILCMCVYVCSVYICSHTHVYMHTHVYTHVYEGQSLTLAVVLSHSLSFLLKSELIGFAHQANREF